MRAPSRVTKR